MAVTGQKVFELSLALIDEVTTTGTIDRSDLSLKTKAIQFLTILQAEMMPKADSSVIVKDLNDELLLNERECLLVLPYGLAAHLVVKDDSAPASFFQQRYEEMRKKKKAKVGQTIQVLPLDGVSTAIAGQPIDGDDLDGDGLDGGGFRPGGGDDLDGGELPPIDDSNFDGGGF